MTLISDEELAAIQEVAESGMKTLVSIYHGAVTRTANGQELTYPDTPDVTVYGWLTEMTPQSSKLNVIDGQTAISETHRLMLPVGTDCRSGDKIVIGAHAYTAQHTNDGDTYPAALVCYLRIQK